MLSDSAPKRSFLYAVKPSSEAPVVTGQFEAENIEMVRVSLAQLLGFRHLPEKTIIMDKADVDEEGDEAWNSVRTMLGGHAPRSEEGDDPAENAHPNWSQILRILTLHSEWLRDPNTGERAYLTGMILTGINLSGRELSQAHLSHADLSGADLRGTNMKDVNLAGANLRGAILQGANLRNADLSEADLRDAVLLDANLQGVDLWRTNIKGIVIKAQALHKAFECRTK